MNVIIECLEFFHAPQSRNYIVLERRLMVRSGRTVYYVRVIGGVSGTNGMRVTMDEDYAHRIFAAARTRANMGLEPILASSVEPIDAATLHAAPQKGNGGGVERAFEL